MKNKIKIKFPALGLRIIKSAIAVMLCFLIFNIFQGDNTPFYCAIAALWCMQPYTGSSKSMAIHRLVGTLIGAFYGLIVMIIDFYIWPDHNISMNYILIAIFVALVIYTATLFKQARTAYFASVVFLGITVTEMTLSNPFSFVAIRLFDTLLGIIIAIFVNNIRIPRRLNLDTLFVAGLDGTLLNEDYKITPYSKVRLNTMLQQGMKFTISTIRTPASIIEIIDEVNINIPVIAMNGAVLYDIANKEYLKAYIISKSTASEVEKFLEKNGFHYFINSIMDNVLMIYYGHFHNEAEETLFKKMRKSPYRNYVNMEHYAEGEVVYIMVLDTTDRISLLEKSLNEAEFTSKLKIVVQESYEYTGYSYLRIFNKNASKHNMVRYLQESMKIKNLTTVGSIENEYDIVVDEFNSNKVVKEIERLFEPYFWKKRRKEHGSNDN